MLIAREGFRTRPVRVCTSAPSFTLPPRSLRRRPRRFRHPAAAVIHNGLSTEKLSTSLLAALCKTFSPSRLRTRIYNISFARRPLPGSVRAAPGECPRRCVPVARAAVRRVGEGEGKGGRPLAQCRTMPLVCRITVCKGRVHKANPAPARALPPRQLVYGRAPAACVPNHSAQWRKCTRQSPPLPVRTPRVSLPKTEPLPAYGRITVCKGGSAQGNPRPCPCVLPAPACLRPCTLPADGRSAVRRVGEGKGKGERPLAQQPAPACLPPRPPPPKWVPRLRRWEGKRPNGAPPHHNAHTPNSARKRYLHNSRTMTQRRTKRCAQFVFFVFTPCKLLHNFSTVLHRSPRNVPKRAQMAARRPDFPCFTARFSNVLPESHRAKHPRTGPVLPPKNAPLRAYAKPRPHSRVRGTRQHVTTCAFFTFSTRYEQGGGARNANFCPAEGRKWGRFRSQMLKNGPQTKKSTFSFGRLVI